MKLVNFFENSKPGSGFQEPSESGCLGKQIKKGKAKKSESKLNEYKYYIVKGPKGFKEKILASHENDAKTKARHLAYRQGKASAGASRFSGTSDSDFEIVESIMIEAISVSDDMIGEPDNFYDAEERQEAHDELLDALDDCRADHEKADIMHGSCPNCSGTGYQDAEYPEYDDDGEEIEDSAFECDGWGMYGCDEGEMVGASWVDIIRHDERKAEKQKAQDNYPGDEAVIDQIARAVKQMDDPRQMYQYMKADYPFMGVAQRSDLIAKGMKKAGLTSESITEGEERSIIHDGCVDKLVDEFRGEEHQFENIGDLEYAIYSELERLDVEDCVDPDEEHGGQRMGDFASGGVLNVIDSSSVIEEVLEQLDTSELEEGRIEDTFGTKTIDKYDKPEKKKKEDTKKNLEIELIKKLSGIKSVDENLKDLERLDLQGYKGLDGKIYKFYPKEGPTNQTTGKPIGMFRTDDGFEALPPIVNPKEPSVFKQGTKIGNDLMKQRIKVRDKTAPGNPRVKKEKPGFFGSLFNDIHEDAESDASEVAVSKMIAKALGNENRWTEMSAAELYAELESQNTEMADMVKDVAKMIYGVKLSENKRDTHCSDKCCGADVKAEDCECSSDCPHCNCNADYIDNKNLGHPDGVTSDEEDKLHGRIHKIREDEITLEDTQDFHEEFGILGFSIDENDMFEAEYQGRKVKLNKPMRGDVKKFKVYVRDPKTGNVKKVNFGHGGTSAKRKTMRIRKSNPKARKSFRARHNCDNPGPKTKARYWSCRKW